MNTPVRQDGARRRGQGISEYGLIVVLLGLLAMAGLTRIRNAVDANFTNTSGRIEGIVNGDSSKPRSPGA